jgi:hypothetical protein
MTEEVGLDIYVRISQGTQVSWAKIIIRYFNPSRYVQWLTPLQLLWEAFPNSSKGVPTDTAEYRYYKLD